MKVIFETVGGTQFPVEVGDSCTLQEMKEKVEKTLQIPIATQILSFNGNILRHDIDLLDVMHGSVINLQVAADPVSFPFPRAPAPAPEPEAEIVHLQLAISPSQIITVKTRVGDTVRELKERIQRKEGTPADHILITTQEGKELPDDGRLRDYATSLNSGVTVEFLQPRKSSDPSVMPSNSSVDADMMRLELQFRGQSLPAVEVRRESLVRELRTKLEAMKFKVPGDRIYSFFHKRGMLIEGRSFASQNVANGDIIRIYSPGTRP